jgi:hypothetical protein
MCWGDRRSARCGNTVALPVVTHYPLVKQQRIQRMRLCGEGPSSIHVRSETNHENTLTFLRHAVVRSVDQSLFEPVSQAIATEALGRFESLQTTLVVKPAFVATLLQFWKLELRLYVFKVVRESSAGQAFDVLDDESTGSQQANDLDRGREHVARVQLRGVFAAHRKRLAGRATGHQVYLPFQSAHFGL